MQRFNSNFLVHSKIELEINMFILTMKIVRLEVDYTDRFCLISSDTSIIATINTNHLATLLFFTGLLPFTFLHSAYLPRSHLQSLHHSSHKAHPAIALG